MSTSLMRSMLVATRDCRGTTAVIYGLMFTIIALSAGGAIDLGRWLHARSVTSAALDAAVIAGGRTLQLDPNNASAALSAAQQYYSQNTASLQLDGNTVTFSIADNKKSLSASGEAYIRTTLLNIAGIERLAVLGGPDSVFPRAQLSSGGSAGSNLEVALVLDVTGSMCDNGSGPCTGGSKMAALKAAANDLIDIVVWDDQSQRTARVAIVPFSTRVRVGPNNGGGDAMRALTNLDPTWTGWYKECIASTGSGGSEGGGNWACTAYEARHKVNWAIMPCVTDRFYNDTWSFDFTDDAPAAGRWLNAHDGGRMPMSWDSTDTLPTNQRGLTPADPATHWNYSPWGCADIAESNEILPLTPDKAALKNRINGLEAYGSTAGTLGTAWGWYMLSPRWSSIWTGTSTPGPYSDTTTMLPSGAPVLRKVAVIMSDGVFNTYRGWKDQDQQMVSDNARQMCSNMKAAGIEIYAVAFALDQLPAAERAIAEATLRGCGTDVHHFYNTINADQLRQAFRDIAVQMSALYLAK